MRAAMGHMPLHTTTVVTSLDAAPDMSANTACRQVSRYIPPIQTRNDLAAFLESEGFAVGVELGVQTGRFAAHTLQKWPSCKRYYLVDLWAQQENYADIANVAQSEQEAILKTAQASLQPWADKLVWLRNLTTKAVAQVMEDVSYVYVDARHDYCGVLEDIKAWWPKIQPGGIMAGHDFMSQSDLAKISSQDWSLCGDGSVNNGAVVGAVNDFFSKLNLQVVITYHEQSFNTWIVRKPELVCES